MKKVTKVLFWMGTVASALVALWHFFVPWLYQWDQYIPSEYGNLIVLIQWVNLFFSFLLLEVSVAAWCKRKGFFAGERDAVLSYFLLWLIWAFRFVVSVILPYPMKPAAALAIAQLVGGIVELIVLSVPLTYVHYGRKDMTGNVAKTRNRKAND